ncbi:alcohol dehydrogenase catalytic domain-containing protein [Nakamurella sp. YIM 132087]|uniref:Alcohol dehydrogenase catalytic domain-containing protein n=1 Tax=Nakamurella alba TaxID=2665158 RepID=A0A7K1FEM7_9ACTN|nr:alcohol dehydrogenase catalytic domain-containing protein [Nakamurella alba]MTD12562.1 alcohol dehydrogenase catalytic domain-containing protein [Nakamurella alba]
MLSARLWGPHDLRLDEVAEPELRSGTVQVTVDYAGICGSDLSFFEHGSPIPEDFAHPQFGETGPHTLGHEFSGHVSAVGDGVEGIAVGDLVAIRPNVWDGTCPACLRGDVNLCENWGFVGLHGGGGGFSSTVVVQPDQVHVLRDPFTAETGAMVESMAVAWRAARRGQPGPGTSALVIGAGPVGLGLVLALKAMGVGTVIVSEPSPRRRELAASLGARTLDPSDCDVAVETVAITAGGVDSAYDASGVGQATFGAGLQALRTGGTLVTVALFHSEVTLSPNLFLETEKSVTGSYAYTDVDFADVVAAVHEGRLDPTPLITSTIGLADIVAKGFEHLLGGGRDNEVKILVTPAANG